MVEESKELSTDIVQPPSAGEDADLVALMRAGPKEETFYVPGKGENERKYWVKVRTLSGVEWDAYNATGTKVQMPFDQAVRPGGATQPSMSAMSVVTDPVARFHSLLKLSVMGYKLTHHGVDVDRAEIRAFNPDDDWQVFRDLPRPVKDWLYDRLCDFHGIEQVEVGEAPAGDS
jgi:hypothetical protein